MENTIENKTTLEKFAYLMDKDNYIIENKIFIDMMWNIAKTTSSKAKSSTIRNASIMIQQIFYWHFNAVKKGLTTTYQYKGKNTIKMDFEDWWNSCRLTDREVTTANKFLKESNLVEIVKMRIKQKDTDVFKPSNCYILNVSKIEEYLNKIVEINKELYFEKVTEIRKKNNDSSKKSRVKIKLSTENDVTTQSEVTSNLNTVDNVYNELLTLSTENTCGKPVDNIPVTTQSEVTVVTTQSGVTNKVTTQSEVTNKSNTSSNTSYTDRSKAVRSNSITKLELLNVIERRITNVAYNTWFISGIDKIEITKDIITLATTSEFVKQILETKFLEIIKDCVKDISSKQYKVVIK